MRLSIIKRKIRQSNRQVSKIIGAYLNSTIFRLVALLFFCNLINVYSVNSFKEVIKQIIIFIVGTCIGIYISNLGYFKIKGFAIFSYIGSIILLLLVALFGMKINGACRWLKIGSFSIQPSEFIKLSLILIVALYLDLRDKPTSKGYDYNILDLFVPLILTTIPVILILKQPDLGTAVICFLIVGSILFFMKIEKKTLIIIMCSLCIGSYVGWHHLKPYQKERIVGFLNPEVDYHGRNWQARQSLVAFGSGGMFGRGMLHGPVTQLDYLPENESDFAMASIGEEHGFVAISFIIIITMLLVFNFIKIAFLSHDRFSTIFSIGMAFIIFWQSIINMLMVLSIIPVVGVPYPIISKGGSNMLVILIAVGIVVSLEKRLNKKLT